MKLDTLREKSIQTLFHFFSEELFRNNLEKVINIKGFYLLQVMPLLCNLINAHVPYIWTHLLKAKMPESQKKSEQTLIGKLKNIEEI